MIEKFIKDTRELNRAAVHLRSQGAFDRIQKLAEEWMVPDTYVKDFIAGKRVSLADIDIGEKDYASGKAKLAEELHILSDEYFADIVGVYLCRKCQDKEYEALVLQKHKSLQKCLNFILKKVYEIAERKNGKDGMRRQQGIGMAMASTQVFQWVDEYYALDDEKEEAEKREKEKADFIEKKKKQEEEKKKKEEREEKRRKNQKKKEARERKKKEEEQNVQMTFDFLDSGENAEELSEAEPEPEEAGETDESI